MHNILENKIREHAGEIFGSEPQDGHRERFAGMLSETCNNKKRISIRQIISYAAIAAIFAGCVFFLYRTINQDFILDDPLPEVQNYYAMQLQDKIDAIEQLLERVDENDRMSLMADIENLQKEAELSMANSDENNTAFVVMTYSSKIEALQHIYNILTDNLLTPKIH